MTLSWCWWLKTSYSHFHSFFAWCHSSDVGLYMSLQILRHLAWCCVPRLLNPCKDWWNVWTPSVTLFRRCLFSLFLIISSHTYTTTQTVNLIHTYAHCPTYKIKIMFFPLESSGCYCDMEYGEPWIVGQKDYYLRLSLYSFTPEKLSSMMSGDLMICFSVFALLLYPSIIWTVLSWVGVIGNFGDLLLYWKIITMFSPSDKASV